MKVFLLSPSQFLTFRTGVSKPSGRLNLHVWLHLQCSGSEAELFAFSDEPVRAC